MKKIFYVFFGFLFFFMFSVNSKAETVQFKEFTFLGETFPSGQNTIRIGLGAMQSKSSSFSFLVSDLTETKPFVNFYMATNNAMVPQTFENALAVFTFKKIPNSTYNDNGYFLDVYVVQAHLLGSWNCSVQGRNCTYGSILTMKNFFNYGTSSIIFSPVLTDEMLDVNDVNLNVDVTGMITQQQQTNQKLDVINDQNTEAENTRKGIWNTLKDVLTGVIELPGKLISLLIDALKSLFIPSSDFFEDFINAFKDNFLDKLGFLSYPFELIADIFDRYMNIATNSVIEIPQIKEPFTGGVLIEATSVNLKEIFEYGAIGTIYGIYRSCVSVLIIVMFLNFAIKKYDEFVKNKGGDN